MKKLLFFGGTFDPPHIEHINMLKSAIGEYKPDKVVVMPTYIPPHKQTVYAASPADRLEACRVAFGDIKNVEVSDYEIKKQGKSYSYLTIAEVKKKYPDYEILFLMGTDMLASFSEWKNPEEILKNATPLLCVRSGENQTAEQTINEFYARFAIKPYLLEYVGKEVSSTECKIYAMLGLPVSEFLSPAVEKYIADNGLYAGDEKFAFIRKNLKQERIKHTAGVIIYALKKCGYYKLDKRKVLTAALLHDCAKYLAADDYPDCEIPQGVPSAVVHQYLGAYIAEKVLGVTDEDVLNAIRYHTSGRPAMSDLEKLIFTADMLERGRNFDGVEESRNAADKDFEEGFKLALKRSYEFVLSSGKPVYELTGKTIEYYKRRSTMDSATKAKIICDELIAKKAFDVLKINVKEKTSLADYFIIASGKSTTQVGSLTEYAMEAVEKAGGEVLRKEGLDDCRWAVVDFGDVILHVFNDETRLFYHLERLWEDGTNVEKIEG